VHHGFTRPDAFQHLSLGRPVDADFFWGKLDGLACLDLSGDFL
jgi:hypothetical protein